MWSKACKLSFIFLLSNSLLAQSPIDSLQTLLQSQTDNLERLSTMTLLAKEYAETNPDTALTITKKLISKANSFGLDSVKGQIFIAKSTANSYMARYDSSTFYSLEALRIAEQYQDTLTIIDAYNNLGIDFMFQEEDAKATAYFQKVEYFARLYGDSLRLGHALTNLGIMESYAGNSTAELDYYQKAMEIFEAIDEAEGLANATLNIGTVYTSLEVYDEADKYYDEALRQFKKLNYSSGIQNTLQSAAENTLNKGDLRKAKKLANESLQIAIENSLDQDVVYTYELLSEIALKSGDGSQAYKYYKLRTEKKEALFTEEKARQISALETEYETAQKEAEIQRLSLESAVQKLEIRNTRIFLIAGVLGAFIVIILLSVIHYQRNKKHKAEKEARELQIEALEKRLLDLNISPSQVELDAKDLNEKIHTPLSEREIEVLTLTLQGKSNSEIAENLFVSVSTVKFHLRNTYGKLGVNNRKEALDYVVKTS